MAVTNNLGKSPPIETSWWDLVSVIVIGRNEGPRLDRCLKSLSFVPCSNLVYVDSASTDGSVALASSLNVHVVELDSSLPFTAARARNAGVAFLSKRRELRRFIQFLDGDCELVCGWLDAALQFITQHSDVAVVCGRRRERHPERSVYNRLSDLEWDTPIGEATACGGDALVRVAAFEQVGGFRSELIAGEEPELCQRLRQARWKIWRIDADMTRHDAAMTKFAQWWRRCVRGGMANAQMRWLNAHGAVSVSENKYLARAIMWAGLLPLAIGIGALIYPAALAGVLIYPLRIVRIAAKRNIASLDSWQYAVLMVILAFAHLEGALRFCRYCLRNKPMGAIGYKNPS